MGEFSDYQAIKDIVFQGFMEAQDTNGHIMEEIDVLIFAEKIAEQVIEYYLGDQTPTTKPFVVWESSMLNPANWTDEMREDAGLPPRCRCWGQEKCTCVEDGGGE